MRLSHILIDKNLVKRVGKGYGVMRKRADMFLRGKSQQPFC